MGYKSMILKLDFDELADEPGTIWVRIRNPKIVTMDHVRPKDASGEIQLDANGQPVDTEAAADSGMEAVARLIVEWSMPDAASLLDEAPMLPQLVTLPTLAEQVKLLRASVPLAVTNRIGELFQEAVAPKS